MQDLNIISYIGNYLIYYAIADIQSKMPDPPSDTIDSEYGEIWSRLHYKEISDLQKRMESIEKIQKHGVIVDGKITANTFQQNDYSSYLTNRIHQFAEDWLKGKSNQDGKYYRNLSDEDSYYHSIQEQTDCEEFGVANMDELISIFSSVCQYRFKSKITYSESLNLK